MHGLVMAYAIVFILGFFQGLVCRICKFILLAFGLINLCVDVAVHTIMHYGFTPDLVAVFMGTNSVEAREFLAMYVNWQMIIVIGLLLFGVVLLNWMVKKIGVSTTSKVHSVGLAIVIISTCAIFGRQSVNWSGIYLMKLYTIS